MWICTNLGFISAVQSSTDPNSLTVRARKRDHLEALFPGRGVLEDTEGRRDYRFRLVASREEVALVVTNAIMGYAGAPGRIDYGNFKNSVRDHRLHDLYADFWQLHYRYQHEEPKTWPKLKGGKRPSRVSV